MVSAVASRISPCDGSAVCTTVNNTAGRNSSPITMLTPGRKNASSTRSRSGSERRSRAPTVPMVSTMVVFSRQMNNGKCPTRNAPGP